MQGWWHRNVTAIAFGSVILVAVIGSYVSSQHARTEQRDRDRENCRIRNSGREALRDNALTDAQRTEAAIPGISDAGSRRALAAFAERNREQAAKLVVPASAHPSYPGAITVNCEEAYP